MTDRAEIPDPADMPDPARIPDLPELMDIRLERCPRCAELMPVRLGEGDRPPVFVRWSLRKSETCDHMIVDAFSVQNWPSE
jgi:hypothetical protein